MPNIKAYMSIEVLFIYYIQGNYQMELVYLE